MDALIRNNELMLEPFPPWVTNNMEYLTKTDGWTLIHDYVPATEEE